MTIYAVNGKEPIAAWIPSLDTAGNGTTTLTDLVGSNNGTLTNMDAATDWVSDTSNGGVRALDFDGSNDNVITNSNFPKLDYSGGAAFCCWVNPDDLSGGDVFSGTNPRYLFSSSPSVIENANALFRLLGAKINFTFRNSATANYCTAQSDSEVLSTGIWQHVAVVHTGSTIVLYYNGSSIASTTTNYSNSARTNASVANIGSQGNGARYLNGRLDDFRIFDQALDASDIAYLYNSGNGRGITATTPNTRRRRYAGGYGL